MRGQQYTVTNMLVWAIFAVAFLAAVYAAYSYLTSWTPPTYLRQIADAAKSAWEARYQNPPRPVVLPRVHIPGGTVITKEMVRRWTGGKDVDVCFSAGPGFEPMVDGVRARTTITARVYVCCQGNKCWLGFNWGSPDSCDVDSCT